MSFSLPSAVGTLGIPPGALIFNSAGLRVATVGADNKVLLKPVTIARDLGASIDIGSGLAATDRVIESPPDGLDNGDLVRVVLRPVKPASGASNPTAAPAKPPASADRGQR